MAPARMWDSSVWRKLAIHSKYDEMEKAECMHPEKAEAKKNTFLISIHAVYLFPILTLGL